MLESKTLNIESTRACPFSVNFVNSPLCAVLIAFECSARRNDLILNLDFIKELSKHDDVQIISVAGRNEDLKEEIDALAKKSKAKIYSYGFTKELEYMMTIADYLVGKTGGITATEAITKGVPLIAVGKTPKPE